MGKGGNGKEAGKKVRTVINGPRQTGTVCDWKGAFGFIQPSKPIGHPKAGQRGGKVFLAAEDVKEELDGIGAKVSFTLYSDNSGLGAADCKMASSAPAAAPAKPAAKGAKGVKGAATKGAAKGAGKTTGKVAPTWSKPAAVQQPAFQKQQKGFAKGAQSQQKGAAKGAAKGQGKGQGGNLIHDKPLRGTVVQWRGKFGWVKPVDTIDHPMASMHQGDLYLGQQDVEQEISGVGAKVKFMLYEEPGKGLSARNVKPA